MTPLTVPWVPTGMNTGVSTAPWAVRSRPRRADSDNGAPEPADTTADNAANDAVTAKTPPADARALASTDPDPRPPATEARDTTSPETAVANEPPEKVTAAATTDSASAAPLDTGTPESADTARTAQQSTDAQTPAQTPAAAQANRSGTGLTADGRACNDPRVAARPVQVVEITTTHLRLFGDTIAPPASAGNRPAERASNDPRGPLRTAAGQG